MFKKIFNFVFLVSALLSFNYFVEAMEQPTKRRKLEQINENEESKSAEANGFNSFNSTDYLEKIRYELGENARISMILDKIDSDVPEHLKKDCKSLIINENCTVLEQLFKTEWLERLKLTEENLGNYRKLLHEMLAKQHPDFNLILSIFDNYFQFLLKGYDDDEDIIFLEDINILLMILIRGIVEGRSVSFDAIASQEERKGIERIIYEAIIAGSLCSRDPVINNDLSILLLKNNLLPALDYHFFETYGENTNFFMMIAQGCYNAELFSSIIDREKSKVYDRGYWNRLFSTCNHTGDTVLHFATYSNCKNKFKVILKLMEEKKLALEDFINIKSKYKKSPLGLALTNHHFEAFQLCYDKEEEVNSLRFLAASTIVQHKRDLISNLPQELQEYCIVLAKINDHYDFLKQFKDSKYYFLQITSENLEYYKKLLYSLLNKQKYTIVNLILNAFNELFEDSINFCHRDFYTRFGDIIKFVLLIKNRVEKVYASDIDSSDLSALYFYAVKSANVDLWGLLAMFDLLPPLGYSYQDTDVFEHVVYSFGHNIQLFNFIINKEKDKAIYNWKNLFNMHRNGYTLLHLAAVWASKDVFESILNLMKYVHLNLYDFINLKDKYGRTPLMIAASQGNSGIIELLINYGALVNLRSNEGLTALDYIEKCIEYVNSEQKLRLARGLALLTEARNN